jgi:hypothetical protein
MGWGCPPSPYGNAMTRTTRVARVSLRVMTEPCCALPGMQK